MSDLTSGLRDSMKERGIDVKKSLDTPIRPNATHEFVSARPEPRPVMSPVKHHEVYSVDSRQFPVSKMTVLNGHMTHLSISKSDLSFEIMLTSDDDILELQRIVNEYVKLLKKE